MTIFENIGKRLKSIQQSKRNVVLSVIFVFLVIVLWVIYERINVFPLDDFIEYWSAGRITLERGNPYDETQMLRTEQYAGWPHDEALMMLNPPWVLPYTMFFGIFSHSLSRFICFLLQVAIVCWSAVGLWRTYGGQNKDEWIAWLVMLTFGPVLHAIKSGQITILVLIGCVGFLIMINNKKDFLAGILASLVLVKPQLLYLFLLSILLWSIYKHRYYVLFGIASAILGSLVFSMIFTPNIIAQYVAMVKEYPLNLWMTSTLGASLRGLFGEEKYYLQFIPSLLGTLWLCVYFYRDRKDFNWHSSLPLVVLVSIVTTPYGWITDYAVLVVSVLSIAVLFPVCHWTIGKIIIFVTYWSANLLIIFLHTSQNWFWWFPSFLLIWYLLSNRYLTNISTHSQEPNMVIN